jgi:hypothetical protein
MLVRLRDGHETHHDVNNHSCRAWLPLFCDIVLPARAKFPPLWTREARAENFQEIAANQFSVTSHFLEADFWPASIGRREHAALRPDPKQATHQGFG